MRSILGGTLDDVFASNPETLTGLGQEIWNLRKWVYENAKLYIGKVPKDKKDILNKIAVMLGNRFLVNSVNSIEYDFASVVTGFALNCFIRAKNVEGIDTIMAESSKFQYKESFHEDLIISAYLEMGEVEKAQGVVNYLRSQNENWANNRAESNQKSINKYNKSKASKAK